MKTKSSLIFAVVVLVLSMIACTFNDLIGQSATPTPQPTFTPLPTYTLQPTFTPIPTATLVPTATPIPQIPGIDFPVTVQDVTLKFYSVTITTGETNVGDTVMSPNPGRSVLVVQAMYTGDMASLINGPYHPENALYITDVDNVVKQWMQAAWSSTSVSIGFFVMTGRGPYILHNTVGQTWSIDLTPLMP